MPPALRAFRLSFSAGCFHQETLFTHSDFMYSKSATANGTCDPVIDWIKTGLWSLCHLNLLNYIIGRRLWISYTQEPWFVSAVSIFFFFILLLPKGKNIQTSQRTSHHDEWKNTGRGEDDSEEQRDGEQRNGATDEEGQREREAISRRCEARIGPSRREASAVFLINSLAIFSSSENFDWV